MSSALRDPLPEPGPARLDRQVDGYWYEPDEPVGTKPPYDPTGALLIAESPVADGSTIALSLVRRNDGTWGPLSHAAVLTYLHSTGMSHGERWKFVVYQGQAPSAIWECVPPLGEASVADVARTFGRGAAERARDDYPTITIRVRRFDGVRS